VAQNFKTIKTYTAQASADAQPSAVTSFTDLEGLDTMAPRGRISRLVELRLDSASVGGTANPTAVTFDIYRWNRLDSTRDYLGSWTIAAADIAAGKVAPYVVGEAYTHYITVALASFTGGTAPTFTGTFQARAVE
jgi:hypothetical protein